MKTILIAKDFLEENIGEVKIDSEIFITSNDEVYKLRSFNEDNKFVFELLEDEEKDDVDLNWNFI